MLYSFVVCLLLLLLSNMEIGLVLWDCPHLLFSEIMNSYLGMVIGCKQASYWVGIYVLSDLRILSVVRKS